MLINKKKNIVVSLAPVNLHLYNRDQNYNCNSYSQLQSCTCLGAQRLTNVTVLRRKEILKVQRMQIERLELSAICRFKLGEKMYCTGGKLVLEKKK